MYAFYTTCLNHNYARAPGPTKGAYLAEQIFAPSLNFAYRKEYENLYRVPAATVVGIPAQATHAVIIRSLIAAGPTGAVTHVNIKTPQYSTSATTSAIVEFKDHIAAHQLRELALKGLFYVNGANPRVEIKRVLLQPKPRLMDSSSHSA